MNSNMSSALNKPSEFYDAVVDSLKNRIGGGAEILNYADFNYQTVKGIQVYVEVDGFGPADTHNDGRHAQQLEIIVHCVVSRSIEKAELQAIDLASAVSRVIKNNCWGLGDKVEFPERIGAAPSVLSMGENAYEGWGVSFFQTIYLGDCLIFDPAVLSVYMAVNSGDESNVGEYERISDA